MRLRLNPRTRVLDAGRTVVGGAPMTVQRLRRPVAETDVGCADGVVERGREGHPVVRGELIGHADAGSQYTSITFADHLADEGIRPSIGSVADAYDNALMECVIGLYKTECIRTTVFQSGPYRTTATSSTPPPAGSTGTTIAGSTALLG